MKLYTLLQLPAKVTTLMSWWPSVETGGQEALKYVQRGKRQVVPELGKIGRAIRGKRLNNALRA